MIDATVITREEFLGGILKLLEEKRGTQQKFEYLGGGRVMLAYQLPLNEIVWTSTTASNPPRAVTLRSTTTCADTAPRNW
jgi:hypothetical protein